MAGGARGIVGIMGDKGNALGRLGTSSGRMLTRPKKALDT